MSNESKRGWVAIAAALLMSAVLPAAAQAVDFTFTTSGGNNTLLGSGVAKAYTSTNAQSVANFNVKVTAWHWDNGDTNGALSSNPNNNIVSAQLGLWSPGLGVIAPGESSGSNEHQIDSIKGVDFIMLQFDHAVSLKSIGREVFDLGFNPDDSDAAYWADTSYFLSNAASAYTANINLATQTYSSSIWTTIAGNGTAGTTAVSGAPTASVWLIGAQPDVLASRNDGFKLSSIVVSAPVYGVPEPATWGMMVIGFGFVGGALRRRARQVALASHA